MIASGEGARVNSAPALAHLLLVHINFDQTF
jgi:hypothetical protein